MKSTYLWLIAINAFLCGADLAAILLWLRLENYVLLFFAIMGLVCSAVAVLIFIQHAKRL